MSVLVRDMKLTLRVIFNQWSKFSSGLDVRPEIPILKRHWIFLGEVCNFYFTIVKNYGNLWINGEPDVIEDGEEKEANQDCDGTVCPGGCCPNAGWFCCPGDEYCAASEEYCKKTDVAKKLISMAAPKRIVKQDCEGTVCPGGCCPNAGWFCCPGDEYCAASEEYCKKTNFAQKMISMAVKLQ